MGEDERNYGKKNVIYISRKFREETIERIVCDSLSGKWEKKKCKEIK